MSFIDVSDSAQHSCEEIISEIHRTKAKLQSSAFYNFVTSSIGESTGLFETILSFGIGRLSTPTSLLQLALYLGLCDKYLSRTMEEGSGVFDPNITSVDREVYKALNITVLSENTKGKHTASNRGKTLFFLPHCPYRLYCNTLWANWEQLDKVYIYGNR